ncbi:hypothetical protein EVAR_65770_1, partial [Eumeta japonica]
MTKRTLLLAPVVIVSEPKAIYDLTLHQCISMRYNGLVVSGRSLSALCHRFLFVGRYHAGRLFRNRAPKEEYENYQARAKKQRCFLSVIKYSSDYLNTFQYIRRIPYNASMTFGRKCKSQMRPPLACRRLAYRIGVPNGGSRPRDVRLERAERRLNAETLSTEPTTIHRSRREHLTGRTPI